MNDLLMMAFWSFVLIFPAFVANSVPVLARGKRPVDFGRNLWDGNRILGDGKTFEGLAVGLIAGTAVGAVAGYPLQSFLLALGALVGDMTGAFIKRRLGIARGKPAPVLDQIDFVVGALAFVYPAFPFALEQAVFLVVVTPPIHLVANIGAYLLKLKPHPW